MRVLVAPDKFKGTLSAEQAGRAIAAGWARGDPEAHLDVVPVADGGEGTLDALVAALGGERRTATVSGPLGDPVRAEYAVLTGPEGTTAVVEMARASGLGLLPESRRDPTRTTTRGTGELVLEACRAGADHVLVCLGGSATNDGGGGLAQAVGVRLLDGRGRDVRPGGAALLDLARIDLGGLDPAVARARFVVATDVDNPLVGAHGASAVYGPQKGASAGDVALLDRALGHLAAVIHRDLGVDVRGLPGAGAAGGLGAGLIAFLGAKLRPGADVVMDAVRLSDRLDGANLVVTGEGTFDAQSLRGKAPGRVLRAAEERRIAAVILCGRQEIDAPWGRVFSLAGWFGPDAAMRAAAPRLEELATEVARTLRQEASGGQGA